MFGCETGFSGWLLMVGFWVGVVAVVLWAVARLFPVAGGNQDAGDQVDRRLATGEIDPETYRQARDAAADAVRPGRPAGSP